MKNKNILLLLSILTAFFAVIILPACNKKFDEPPASTTTLSQLGIVANSRVDSVKARVGNSTGAFVEITDSLVITGVVSGNDRTGNLYKELYMQDSTGGISILLNATGLYNTYAEGREIAINCKGLWLINQNGMKKLCQKAVINGSTSAVGINPAEISKYLHTGATGQPVAVKTVTVDALDNSLLGMLVKLENSEVASGELSYTYSDISPAKIDQNIDIKNCAGLPSIIVRTSAYASFAAGKVPQGNGSITAIYTIYNTTKQLLLRDTTDVDFTGPRCFLFEQDFSGVTNNSVLDFPGWYNIGEIGGKQFTGKTFGSSGKVGYITAFNSGQPVIKSWLITPAISLAAGTTPHLSFTTSENFDNGATLTALISTDYNGSATPSASTWVNLNAVIASGATGSAYSPFVSSGQIDLSAYVGRNVYIAFRYDGGDPSATTNFEIDDMKISSH